MYNLHSLELVEIKRSADCEGILHHEIPKSPEGIDCIVMVAGRPIGQPVDRQLRGVGDGSIFRRGVQAAFPAPNTAAVCWVQALNIPGGNKKSEV